MLGINKRCEDVKKLLELSLCSLKLSQTENPLHLLVEFAKSYYICKRNRL
jgi:hypothetical protein